ncbi:MAG TPA: molybdopterin cofactor-binding domain-containing protein [Gemmataceae bacterium]|jgi:isoquinoline 1-oxidoreductase|nr:molybdopterin cofactor-binding domain-containing protein [Gemmataceae bacterium]
MSEQVLDGFLTETERYELREPGVWDWDRREFFRIVGGGLVIALLADRLEAQQPPGGRGRGGFFGGNQSREIAAWLHIGEDSSVTVFTGKVEIGQNIRTSFTQVVAEELRTPVERITLVMADTARCPDDGGTAGSGSTPRTAAQLRRVAAAARESLLDLAAEKNKLDRKELHVDKGHVVGPAGKSFAFGQLTKGKKLLKEVSANAPTTPADKWTVEGTSVSKVNARAIVTGAHQYASDVRREGMVHGKVLRPPAFDAQLTSLDTKDAEALPGVKVVRDGNFVGVVAPTSRAAAEARDALKAEWKTTKQISSGELFTYLKENARGGGGGRGGGGRGGGGGNSGSIDVGLKSAAHKLQATYTIAFIAHVPMEPRTAVAEWDGDKLTVWTGTQMPMGVRGELAGAFRIPPTDVRVIVPDMGSGYGGKHRGDAAVEAARLAKGAGKPVKLVWTREEEFTWAYFRPAGLIEINSGVSSDGKLTAWEFHNYHSGGSAIGTPYDVPNKKHEQHGLQNPNKPLRVGSYRALASTANNFARESHMDDLAKAAGVDPLAFRLKNLSNDRLRAVLEAAAKQFGWGKPSGPDRGYGLACGTEKGSYIASCAEVAIDKAKGQVRVVRAVSAFECGAILNPDHLKNQVEGCLVMGLGGALFEHIDFEDGKILNPTFGEYRLPRFKDVPMIETVLVNRPDLPSAGAGETPIIGIAPAVGNAIFAATGVRLRSMPMVPDGLKLS